MELNVIKYFEKRKLTKEKQKLTKYLSNLESIPDIEYLDRNKDKIDCLKWLVAYYEGRSGANPKELLESMLHPIKTINCSHTDWIKILYYWHYYKRIVGF